MRQTKEDKKDEEWLQEERDTFPEEIISAEEIMLWPKDGGIKERLRNATSGVFEAFSPKRPLDKIRASTPEDSSKRRRAVEGRTVHSGGEG